MSVKLDFGKIVSWGFNGTTSRNFLIRLALWTAALILILYALFGPKILASYGPMFQANYDLVTNPNDMQASKEVFRILGGMAGVLSLFMLMFWALMASAETAFHKNVFFQEDRGMFPLRFGVSELKLMAAQLFVMACWVLTYIVSILAMLLFIFLGGLLGAIFGTAGAIILTGIFALVGIVFLVWVNLYVFARLFPAGALTIANDKITTGQVWKLTKGNASPIVFAILLVGLVGYVLMAIIQYGGLAAAFPDSGILSVMMSSPSQNPADTFAIMAEQIKSPGTKAIVFFGLLALAALMPFWYLGFWGIGNRAAIDLNNSGE